MSAPRRRSIPPPAPQEDPTEEVILATAGYDHTIKFWQAHTGQCILTLQHPDSHVNAMDISPDGQLLAACGYQHIRMFEVIGSMVCPVLNYEGVRKNVMGVGFQEEGRWMYTGGEDTTVKIWDLRMRNLQCQRIFQAGAPVNSVILHPNQQEIVVGDQNGIVHVWNLRSDTSEQFNPEPGSSIQCVTVDPQGIYVAALTNKGNAYLSIYNGDLREGVMPTAELANPTKITAHKRYGLKCKFSPDSSMLVTSSADQTAKVWRTSDSKLITELTVENQRWVWDIAFSADSQYLFTASSDNMARLWSIPEATVKRVYQEDGHSKAVTSIAFRDGQIS